MTNLQKNALGVLPKSPEEVQEIYDFAYTQGSTAIKALALSHERLRAELTGAESMLEELRNAIATHRSQKADDRCWLDDDTLYAALGDGIKCDRRVGGQAAMLRNCQRFIENRCEGGGWPSYAELEAEIARLKGTVKGMAQRIAEQSELLGKRAEKKV